MPTHLELASTAELIHMILRNLRDLEQPNLPLVIDNRTTLDVRLGLVGNLHYVFSLVVNHGLHDVQIDDGTEVVDVRNEDVFLAGCDELVEKARVTVQCQ